uniref:Sushi, nidogen and EGF-like domain-containing protein 1-like n=1 Tax=Saccoglossus kowalevskii TaxID=10224 RepID=A0ABM0M4F1_SACKO|nr:PREDICTED: sushi, nidogen and EGF-like domain-containing protein 1-like [Saccoglossus kowalevskii]
MWKWNVFLVLITCFRPAPILGYAKKSNPHGSYPKTMLLPDKLTGLEKTHPHRVTKRATCGQILTSSTGTVTSPNYPSNYPSNSNCVTTIQAPTNKIIEITLTDVKIEIESYTSSGDPDHPAGIRCLWDYVEFEDVGIARTKYCGEFSGRVWTSFDSKVNVLFFSDDSAQYRGFAASYTFLDKPTDPLMFDFGVSTADIEFPPADDGSVVLNGISYTFFGTSHSQLWVNTNGVLSFDDEELSYSPLPIPHGTNHLLAPYWADVDVRSGGQLFYRQTTDTATLDKADTIISSAFGINFQSTSAIVITWYDVAFFATSAIGQKSRNTFQAVLVTDSNGCGHVIFNYADITWTTGASVDAGGDVNTGLGGIAAQVCTA